MMHSKNGNGFDFYDHPALRPPTNQQPAVVHKLVHLWCDREMVLYCEYPCIDVYGQRLAAHIPDCSVGLSVRNSVDGKHSSFG